MQNRFDIANGVTVRAISEEFKGIYRGLFGKTMRYKAIR